MKILLIGDIVAKLGRAAIKEILPDLIVKEKIGYDKEPIYTEALKGDLKSMKLSYKKATNIYGYKPKYTPEEGILEMIDLFE